MGHEPKVQHNVTIFYLFAHSAIEVKFYFMEIISNEDREIFSESC